MGRLAKAVGGWRKLGDRPKHNQGKERKEKKKQTASGCICKAERDQWGWTIPNLPSLTSSRRYDRGGRPEKIIIRLFNLSHSYILCECSRECTSSVNSRLQGTSQHPLYLFFLQGLPWTVLENVPPLMQWRVGVIPACACQGVRSHSSWLARSSRIVKRGGWIGQIRDPEDPLPVNTLNRKRRDQPGFSIS